MKKLLITLCVLVATIAFPSSAFSQQEDKTWEKGDLLVARHICKTEDTIMKVVLADTRSERETLTLLFTLSQIGDCKIFRVPLPFLVHSIVTPYKDFAGKDSIALALQDPANENPGIFAYAIALGVVKKVKGI
jgi:hypothetical protein